MGKVCDVTRLFSQIHDVCDKERGPSVISCLNPYFHLFQSPKEVLLNVKMGVPGERRYYPPEELVWDASRDSSPRSLRTCLASHYGLSPDSLLLAKHQLEKHTWDEISNWVR